MSFLLKVISQSYGRVQWEILLKLTNFQHRGLHSASTWKILLWHQPHMVGDRAGTRRNRHLTAVLLSCWIHQVGEFPEIAWVLSVGNEHIPATKIHSHTNKRPYHSQPQAFLHYYDEKLSIYIQCFFPPMPPHVLVDFVVFPPGHGRSVTDFWGWDAHEAWLCCPDDVRGDIGGCSARRALNLPRPWSTWESSPPGKIPMVELKPGPHD